MNIIWLLHLFAVSHSVKKLMLHKLKSPVNLDISCLLLT